MIALAAALAALAPAAASAQVDLGPPPDSGWGSFDLTSSSLVYGTGRPLGVFERRASGTRRLRQFDSVLRRTRPPRTGERKERDFHVAASSRFVVVGLSTSSSTRRDDGLDDTTLGPSTVVVAPRRGGVPRRLVRCRTRRVGPVRVDRSIVGYMGARCRDRIEVRDARNGRHRLFRPPRGLTFVGLEVAGRYLAAEERNPRNNANAGSRIAVYDWPTGRRLFTAPPGSSYDIAADGRLAVSSDGQAPDCRATRVTWYSPAEPRPHVLTGACAERVLLAGDRLLWGRATSTTPRRGEFVVTDLETGSTTRPLFTSDTNIGSPTYFDPEPVYFSGQRVGYHSPGCDPSDPPRLVIDSVADLQARGPHRPVCAQR